jgi:hypothetical protein
MPYPLRNFISRPAILKDRPKIPIKNIINVTTINENYFSFMVRGSTNNVYTCQIQLFPPQKNNANIKSTILDYYPRFQCTCADFMFRFAPVLARHNMLIDPTILNRPDKNMLEKFKHFIRRHIMHKKPRQIQAMPVYVCKHLEACIDYLLVHKNLVK